MRKAMPDLITRENIVRLGNAPQNFQTITGPLGSGPAGIGGWLLLLVIVLIAVAPIGNIGNMLGAAQYEQDNPVLLGLPAWETYKKLAWCLVIASSIASCLAGYRLCNVRTPGSVAIAIGAIWFCGPLCMALRLIAEAAAFDVGLAQVLGGHMSLGIGSVLGASLWTAYLKRSRRVRNTYFRCIHAGESA
ncbi:DUF2569 family protein [Achromobacter ruhlandii]|uniref:DUF2569 family protein n=1 Tax=Achromobacter ruhlandii TaxID=72557 RepID=UPI00146568D1|nr:DUF2569 family protein [Achromobacter ruhlandii]CAB3844315.1 hypothetical protein LMG1864_01420 [Achromobacter ruhlandii]